MNRSTYISRIFSVLILTLIIVQSGLTIPPLDRDVREPHYPAGVNTPSSRLYLSRDDIDLEGEWRCLVILVDFPDYPWNNQNDEHFPNRDTLFTQRHFQQMLFSERTFGHPGAASQYTGSMRDYYTEVSSGSFTVTGIVTRWYRAPQNYSYYCNNDGEAGTPDDYGFGGYPNNVQRLVEDAVRAADDEVNFEEYDNDGDDAVDGLFIVHAGPGAEELPAEVGADYFWSHKWQIMELEVDGVRVSEYTMQPQTGTIGVFCHEFGHALGIPDLYDTDGTSEGVGEWCLMGSGGWCYRPGDPPGTCPDHMCAWVKTRLEWTEIANLQQNRNNVLIPPVIAGGMVYRLWTNGELGAEYFLIENRLRRGFDAGIVRRQIEYNLPAPQGLLITRIDEMQRGNQNDRRRLVDIVEASYVLRDGQPFEHLDGDRIRPDDRSLFNPNRGDNGDLWPGFSRLTQDSTDWTGNRDRDHFGSFTIPSTIGYDGNPSFVDISNIRLDGENIICDIQVSPPAAPMLFVHEFSIDDSEGNGNGRVESGEPILLTVSLINRGTREAANVIGNLSSPFGWLQITRRQADYGRIAANASCNPNQPYIFILSEDAPAVNRLHFDLLVTALDNQDTLRFPLQFDLPLGPTGEWVKLPGNPVLTGTLGSWDALGIISTAVIVEGDTVKCWYNTGGMNAEPPLNAVGYAWSLDGGEHWRKYPEPVMQVNPDLEWMAGGMNGLAVMRSGNGYLMAFYAENADTIEPMVVIGSASSRNGIDWIITGQPIIINPGRWAESLFGMGCLSLARYNNMIFCGYTGMAAQGFIAIGGAISPDGRNWQHLDLPVIIPTGNAEDFDAFAVMSPDLTIWPDVGRVIYGGLGADFTFRFGLIHALDLNRLERQPGGGPGGSILEAGGADWEMGGFLFGARLFEWQGQKRLLYTVFGQMGAAAGLALQGRAQAAPIVINEPLLPKYLTLESVHPNPFNNSINLTYNLAVASAVELVIYDGLSRRIVSILNREQPAGRHTAVWDGKAQSGKSVPSGIYFARINAAGQTCWARLALMK